MTDDGERPSFIQFYLARRSDENGKTTAFLVIFPDFPVLTGTFLPIRAPFQPIFAVRRIAPFCFVLESARLAALCFVSSPPPVSAGCGSPPDVQGEAKTRTPSKTAHLPQMRMRRCPTPCCAWRS